MRIITTVLAVILMASCSNQKTETIKDASGNIQKEYEYYENEHGAKVKNGVCKTFLPGGELEEISNYIDGKQNGLMTTFYKSGSPYIEVMLKDDIKHGEGKVYYENGEISIIANYKEGEKDGVYKVYNDEQEIVRDVVYLDGVNQTIYGKWIGTGKGEYDFKENGYVTINGKDAKYRHEDSKNELYVHSTVFKVLSMSNDSMMLKGKRMFSKPFYLQLKRTK